MFLNIKIIIANKLAKNDQFDELREIDGAGRPKFRIHFISVQIIIFQTSSPISLATMPNKKQV